MASKLKALQQATDLEETRPRRELAESQAQPQTKHNAISNQVLQRTITNPGTARPEHLRAVSQAYGNQAVMRLVEKARHERQMTTTSPAIQRIPTTVQREGSEVEARKQKLKDKLRKAKLRKKLLLGGRKTANLFKNLLYLPLRVVDQISVVDLHLKDAIKYAKTGKTKEQRDQEKEKSSGDRFHSKFVRFTGRSGLTGYAHGFKSHSVLYGGEGSGNGRLPVLGSRFNPVNALHNINTEKLSQVNRDIKQYTEDLWLLENPGRKLAEMPGRNEVEND